MNTGTAHAPRAAHCGPWGRSAIAALVTLIVNALLAGGLALWEARKDDPPEVREDTPVLLVTVETQPVAAEVRRETPAREVPRPAVDQPSPEAVPELDIALPAWHTAAPVAVPPGPAPDLSAWAPDLDFRVLAPPGPGPSPPAQEAAAHGRAGPTRGPVLRRPPDMEAFYPTVARTRTIEGRSRVRLRIDRAGRVAEVTVLSSTPAGIFDTAAERAGRAMSFAPALRDGEPVPSVTELNLVWRMR